MTQERLKELFDYHPGGYFLRKTSCGKKFQAGDRVNTCVAGTNGGYYYFAWKRKRVVLHRGIFLFHHGYLPVCVDHINRNRFDNRIENLREATKSLNAANCPKYKGTSSQYKGVSFKKSRNKYVANISRKHIGLFTSEVEAAKAYDSRARELYGEFACTNF